MDLRRSFSRGSRCWRASRARFAVRVPALFVAFLVALTRQNGQAWIFRILRLCERAHAHEKYAAAVIMDVIVMSAPRTKIHNP